MIKISIKIIVLLGFTNIIFHFIFSLHHFWLILESYKENVVIKVVVFFLEYLAKSKKV